MSRLIDFYGRLYGAFFPIRSLHFDNAAPVISFTFDALPEDARLAAAAALEAAGGLATFFLTPDQYGSPIKALVQRGHEFGALLVGDGRGQPKTRLQEGYAVYSAAFSEAFTGGSARHWAQETFTAIRSRESGLNHGVGDLGRLSSYPLANQSWDEKGLSQLLSSALDRKAWLIFRIDAIGSQDEATDAARLAAAARMAQELGFEILTVRNAVGAVGWQRDWNSSQKTP